MPEGSEQRDARHEGSRGNAEDNVRPQKAGEAATTRFGMEEGDNTDVPATGGPTSEDEPSEGS